MSKFIKGNQFQLFYHNGTGWKALAFATSHSFSVSDNYEDISCKEFGMYPKKDLTSSSAEVSGEYIYTDAAYTILSKMQANHQAYSFCFAKINDTDWKDEGYNISDIDTDGAIHKYFDGYVAVSLSTESGSNASMSVTITGSGAVTDTVMSTITSYTAS